MQEISSLLSESPTNLRKGIGSTPVRLRELEPFLLNTISLLVFMIETSLYQLCLSETSSDLMSILIYYTLKYPHSPIFSIHRWTLRRTYLLS